MAYSFDNLSVKRLGEVLKKTQTIIIPVGIVEQHGFHLPLTTDIFMACCPIDDIKDEIEAVIAPPINYCFSGGELLGTININPNIFALYLSDICLQFVKAGFKDVVVFCGHGGTENNIAVQNALQMTYRNNRELTKDVTFSMIDCFMLSPSWLEYFNQEPEHDFHAGTVETALMMHWKPELVMPEEMEMDDDYYAKMMRTDPDWFAVSEKVIDHPFIIPNVKQRDEIRVGVMGFPELATKEIGEKVALEMKENFIKYIKTLQDRRKK